jgi:hypothetical protein
MLPRVMGSIGSLRRAIWPAYRAGAALVEHTSIPALNLLPMTRDQNLMGPNKGRADVSIRAFAVQRPIFWSGRIGMVRNSPGLCACRIGWSSHACERYEVCTQQTGTGVIPEQVGVPHIGLQHVHGLVPRSWSVAPEICGVISTLGSDQSRAMGVCSNSPT